MAQRPVFTLKDSSPFFDEIPTTFTYCSGFSDIQRKRSSENLKGAFLSSHPGFKVLEVSRFSDNILGQKLSAFNLLTELNDGSKVPVENAFQSSKVFSSGMQCLDLLHASPMAAKQDPRIKSSGALSCFKFQDLEFPLEPKTYFYDWLYINALLNNPDVARELMDFNAFTDIVFNPEKSINCQARTVAIFVSLSKNGLLKEATSSADVFKTLVYGESQLQQDYQLSLFD